MMGRPAGIGVLTNHSKTTKPRAKSSGGFDGKLALKGTTMGLQPQFPELMQAKIIRAEPAKAIAKKKK